MWTRTCRQAGVERTLRIRLYGVLSLQDLSAFFLMHPLPDFIPALSEHLSSDGIDVKALLRSISDYLRDFPKPDHYEDPFDFIEAMDYKEKIEPFLKVLNNERT